MKRKFVIVAVAIVIAICFAGPGQAFAAWVGSTIRGEAEIVEPISTVQDDRKVSISPGESFVFEAEVSNNSPVTYGLRYQGLLWWLWMFQGIEEVKEIALEELPESGEVTFSVSGGSPRSYGYIEIYVNGEAYVQGSVVNIRPNETHQVKVIVNTYRFAPAGKVLAIVDPFRGDPVRRP